VRKPWNSLTLNRRHIFTAGAVAAVAGGTVSTLDSSALDVSPTLAAPAPSTTGGAYGSGTQGSWAKGTRSISAPDVVQRVVASDGVFMFGDSLAIQDWRSLAVRLRGRDRSEMAVHNWGIRPTYGAVDALERWASTYGLPRRILMSCGSNDIFAPPKFAEQIERAMSIVGTAHTLFWIDLAVSRIKLPMSVQLADQRNSGWLNMQLYQAQEKHPNLRIIRWAEWLWDKPYRLSTCLRDGVHSSIPVGQNARNELIVQSLTK
jgi:hypothetical protein